MDSPGVPSGFWPSEEGEFDHVRSVFNAWEYVRVGIGGDPQGDNLLGSRASDFYQWGSMITLGADGSVPEGFQRVYDDFYGTNYIGLGYHFPLE